MFAVHCGIHIVDVCSGHTCHVRKNMHFYFGSLWSRLRGLRLGDSGVIKEV